eukprot:750069_1
MESKRMHCTNQQISNHAASNTNVRIANLSISIRTSHDDVMRPLSPPSDPFMNDPQSNGTSYPILWRVHGPTPHNWRCFGLDVGRHCYLLIQYIVLLAIYIGDCFHPHTIIIQIAMESNTNDAIPIHLLHALSRLVFWRTGASIMATTNPNQTRLRAFRSNPIPLPRSTFHRIESKWQNPFLSTRSVHSNRERAIPRTTSDDLITYCTTSIRSSNVAWKTDTQSIQCRIPTMHLHWFQWMRFWRTKHSIHSCNEWYVKSPWYSSAFLRSFRMIIIIIT